MAASAGWIATHKPLPPFLGLHPVEWVWEWSSALVRPPHRRKRLRFQSSFLSASVTQAKALLSAFHDISEVVRFPANAPSRERAAALQSTPLRSIVIAGSPCQRAARRWMDGTYPRPFFDLLPARSFIPSGAYCSAQDMVTQGKRVVLH